MGSPLFVYTTVGKEKTKYHNPCYSRRLSCLKLLFLPRIHPIIRNYQAQAVRSFFLPLKHRAHNHISKIEAPRFIQIAVSQLLA